MIQKKSNVLVIGGAGFIGSHITKALVKNSYFPITYDNLSLGHKSAIRYGILEEGDIHDTTRLSHIFTKYNPVAVFHFAAYASVAESIRDPAQYYYNNVVGTYHLLEALRQYGPVPFIFSSTCAIYGSPKYIPIDENHPQDPINPYGRSKLMVEKIIRDYHKAYNIPYALLRYFNAAGADLDCELGENHEPETHLIPLILDVILQKKPFIEIYGTDYDTPDGTAIRDYIHVQDLAEAHIKSLEFLGSGNTQLELNLGTGKGYSVKEIIAEVERICNQTITKKFCNRREGDAPILVADSSKSKLLLNWVPKYSDLSTLISSAWKWRQNEIKSCP